MICPKCKAPLPEGSSFCPRCGVPIAKERRCPKCQSVIASNSVFCPKCGVRLDADVPVSQASASSAAAPTFTPASAPAPAPAPTPPQKNRIFTLKNVLIVLVVVIAARGVGYLMGTHWPHNSKSAASSPSVGASINKNLGTGVNLKKDFDVETALAKSYNVSLVDAVVYTDDQGEPILLVTYKFTNNSDETQSFSGATIDKASQNGKQILATILIGKTASQYGFDPTLTSQEVQPGMSLDVQRLYSLDSPTGEVEVEVVTNGPDSETLWQSTILLPE